MPHEETLSHQSGTRRRVFTEYVASLETSGDPPDRESFDRVWHALKVVLRTELRRRGLWTSPPRFVGVMSAELWNEEALEELATDAYVFNFVDRLRSLRAQLEVKPNVDGLVRLNLKNFLYERQRRHDPLGCRLFMTLRKALEDLVELGELETSAGGSAIRNDTVLHFAPALSEHPDRVPSAVRCSLPDLASAWSDEMLHALVTSRGGRLEEVTAKLRLKIRGLCDHGYDELSVKNLADALKTAVRERWRALHVEGGLAGEDEEGDRMFRETRRRYRPDEEIETTEAFDKLTRCMEARLRALDTNEKFGEYLNVLWQFLRLHAVGECDLPSRRNLAERLGIPRNRFPDLYEALGDLLENCRQLLFEPPAGRERGRR